MRALPFVVCVAIGAATSVPVRAAEPTKKECVNANESGQDLRQSGKLREARAALAVCMSPRCPRPVREDCAQRLADIEAALPTLVFVAKDGDGNDVADVHVGMNRQDLTTSDGSAVTIDPGEHAFTFSKEGLPPVARTVVVHEGDKNRRIQVVLGAPSAAPSEAKAPAVSTTHPNGNAGTEATGLFGLAPGTQRGLGLGVGIAGVVGLGVGTVFGILTKVTYDHAFQVECHEQPNGCSAKGIADRATAGQQADVATIAFAVGGVLTVAGVVLYLETPAGTVSVSPAVSTREAGVGIAGRF